MDYFTVNLSFGQQVIFVELPWSSLILKAAHGNKKKEKEKKKNHTKIYLHELIFPAIMPASFRALKNSHMNSFTENTTFTCLQLPLYFSQIIQLINTGRLHKVQ